MHAQANETTFEAEAGYWDWDDDEEDIFGEPSAGSFRPIPQAKAAGPEFLTMRFTDVNLRQGEQALLYSRPFLVHGLSLLQGVRSADLHRSSDGRSLGSEPDCRYDYLICQGDTVWLAVCLDVRHPWYGELQTIPGLPVISTSQVRFAGGDVASVLRELERVEGEDHLWNCPLTPCPPEWMAALTANRLVTPQAGSGLTPTEYGMSCGFIGVSQGSQSRVMCTRRASRYRAELLVAQARPQPPWRAQIPLAERMLAFRSGRFDNNASAARLVQEMMDTPLESYLEGYPPYLNLLKRHLPIGCTTFGAAALEIDKMLRSANPKRSEKGLDLMISLAHPVLEDSMAWQFAQSGDNLAEKLPDYPQERYYRLYGSPTHSLDRPRKPPASTQLAAVQLAGFFQGVGALARSGYPDWLAGAIRSYLKLPDRYYYADALWTAQSELSKGNSGFYAGLLYLLLIEPCCVINANQSLKKERNDPKWIATYP